MKSKKPTAKQYADGLIALGSKHQGIKHSDWTIQQAAPVHVPMQCHNDDRPTVDDIDTMQTVCVVLYMTSMIAFCVAALVVDWVLGLVVFSAFLMWMAWNGNEWLNEQKAQNNSQERKG